MTSSMNSYPTEAARLIAEWCAREGVSHSELSRRVGRSRVWACTVINGSARYPGLTTMMTVAEVTGIPFEALTADRPAPKPPAPKLKRPGRVAAFTMAEVRQAIADGAERPGAEPLSAAWRQEILRHLDRLPSWLDRPLDRIPAEAQLLRLALERLHPVSLGVSRRVWQKAHAAIRTALAIAGTAPRARSAAYLADPRWRALMTALRAHGREQGLVSSFHAKQLGRLFAYCHANDIAPEDVTEQVFAGYVEERNRCDLGTRAGSRRQREARNAWNYAAAHVAGWPPVALEAPRRETLRLVWESFPRSFLDDVHAYVKAAGVRDAERFDADVVGYDAAMTARAEAAEQQRRDAPSGRRRHSVDPSKPLAAETAQRHSDVLRSTASVLVRAGMDAAAIRSIADVATPTAAIELLKDLDRRGLEKDKATRGTLVKHLASVSARWLPDHDTVKAGKFLALFNMVGRRRSEMSEDDRQVVHAFLSDSEMFARVVKLPLDIVAASEAERRRTGRVTEAMALRVRGAAMLTILLSLPVRRTTLSRTRWERVTWPARVGAIGLVYWPPEDVKTRDALRAELSGWKMDILRLYRTHYWPVLTLDPENPCMFPGRVLSTRGGSGSPAQLAASLKELIHDAIGHRVRAHQWRKVLGTALFRATLDVEMVKALLGHSERSNSTQVYLDSLKTLGVSATLDRVMSDLLADTGLTTAFARAA